MSMLTRRGFVKLTGGVAAAGMAGFPFIAKANKHKVVVIGGGYGGAIAAKYIRKADPSIEVTLVEKNAQYVSCPLSNPVLIGLRDISVQTWGYDGLKAHGINVIHDEATAIDPTKKSVTLKGGQNLDYDKLIVSPGVSFKWGAIEGYDEAATEKMPHAWKAGPQTLALKQQIENLKDGENIIIVPPPDPFRCPPGPYERASLLGYHLQKHKPKSKVLVLDPKDKFSKFGLFKGGWEHFKYPIEWVPGGEGGKVTRVDPATLTVYTEMDEHKGGVVNVIPAQHAGHIAHVADLVDDSGWCPVNLKTFESSKHKDVYVIGDASIATGLPKSGYSANSEAKVAAAAIVATLSGKEPGDPSYVNTCYSLIHPDYGISVAIVKDFKDGKINQLSSGLSPTKASDSFRKQEAMFAESWYQSIMTETFS
jgi:sulfide dehydrogenase [flavocytochrome c] flavoprotein subunit